MTRSLDAEQVVDVAGLETSSRLKSTVQGLELSTGKIERFYLFSLCLFLNISHYRMASYCNLLFLSTLTSTNILETTSLLHHSMLSYFPIVHLSPIFSREKNAVSLCDAIRSM